ncbi:unnamed protein product [Coffea canephora]|uniref:Uncharacterized protein n=1 Tax=Coffea canephora TaxID=49390 RepID=A0A068V6U6_COFCA|nr:unnamed protein product [Coffea canephora]
MVNNSAAQMVFDITAEHNPSLEGHVFSNPVDASGYMVMLWYKNGSLTREDIRNRCAEKSWEVFNKLLQQTPPRK